MKLEQYADNDDATNSALDNARTAVFLLQVDLTSGVYRLKSQYVDIADFELPNNGFFTQATSDFSFTRDNDAFEAVNSFYHLDKSMRYINETFGIVCRPFLNDGVFQFDPSGVEGADNSHYTPSTNQIAFGEGCVDDAEDAHVVLYEIGHGIYHWITGGHASSLTGLGEGTGDYWAMSYSRSRNLWAALHLNMIGFLAGTDIILVGTVARQIISKHIPKPRQRLRKFIRMVKHGQLLS